MTQGDESHESHGRCRLHARGGPPVPRVAGPDAGPCRLCREDAEDDGRRNHAGCHGGDDEGVGADERGGAGPVEAGGRPDEREDVTAPAGSTIYALSSGNPTAAIAIVRVSGSRADRSEEHTSELQSLMRNSY